MAAMILSVSALKSVPVSPARAGRPGPGRSGDATTLVTLGSRDERGHTCSVPHTPSGITGAPVAAARRAAPDLPRNRGSKNASPRGIVPCGVTISTSPLRRASSAAS